MFGAVTDTLKTYCPAVSAGAVAVLTVSDSVPAPWFTAQSTRAADGAHAIVPRLASVPAPLFVTFTTCGPAVPPAATVRFTMLALSESTGCRIVKFTTTFCGLLNAPTAETGTSSSAGLTVSPVGAENAERRRTVTRSEAVLFRARRGDHRGGRSSDSHRVTT